MSPPARMLPIDRYATVTLHKRDLALLIQLVSRLHWSPDESDLADHTADELRLLLAHLGAAWQIIDDRERRSLVKGSSLK